MNSLNLFKMIRLHIVVGGILAFLIGVLMAKTQACTVEILKIFTAYGVVFLGDLSTHFSNDFFDFEIDKQVEKNKYFSGRKILVKAPHLKKKAKYISQILIVVSILLAFVNVFFLNGPLLLLIIALAVDLLGWFYSAPPLRLSNRNLGEITVAFATGFAIPSIGYLSIRHKLDFFFLLLTIPFMLYGFILSFNLESPDINTDKKYGKRNLASKITSKEIAIYTVILTMISTIIFIAISYLVAPSMINIIIIAIFSTIPLVLSLLTAKKIRGNWSVNTGTTINIFSLILFNILIILYLFLIIII